MRFRDVRMTRIKNAIYPPELEPPTLTAEELRGIPEPTPRWLSRYIGKTATKRKRSLPLEFGEPTINRAQQRANATSKRTRPAPLTAVELPWKAEE